MYVLESLTKVLNKLSKDVWDMLIENSFLVDISSLRNILWGMPFNQFQSHPMSLLNLSMPSDCTMHSIVSIRTAWDSLSNSSPKSSVRGYGFFFVDPCTLWVPIWVCLDVTFTEAKADISRISSSHPSPRSLILARKESRRLEVVAGHSALLGKG